MPRDLSLDVDLDFLSLGWGAQTFVRSQATQSEWSGNREECLAPVLLCNAADEVR